MEGIFICYRREDTAGHAGRLFDHLCEHFGKEHVFMDVAGIEPGVDFVESIETAVSSCEVLIVVIGKNWLECADTAGKRRLEDQNDFIRLETATALRRNIRVIPLLVQGAAMPPQDRLPEELKKLSTRQSIEISDNRWNSDVNQFVETLTKVLGKDKSAVHSPDKKSHFEMSRKQSVTIIIVAMLLLIGGGLTKWAIQRNNSAPDHPGSVTDINRESANLAVPQKPQDTGRRSDVAPRQTGPRDEILGRLTRAQWKGVEMLQQGEPDALGVIDQTLREAREAAGTFPDDARFYEVMGYLLKDVYQCEASKRLLSDDSRHRYLACAYDSARKALRIAPDSASAHNLMGNVLYFKGKCDAAIREYDVALRLNRNKDYEKVISGDRRIAVQARDSNTCSGH